MNAGCCALACFAVSAVLAEDASTFALRGADVERERSRPEGSSGQQGTANSRLVVRINAMTYPAPPPTDAKASWCATGNETLTLSACAEGFRLSLHVTAYSQAQLPDDLRIDASFILLETVTELLAVTDKPAYDSMKTFVTLDKSVLEEVDPGTLIACTDSKLEVVAHDSGPMYAEAVDHEGYNKKNYVLSCTAGVEARDPSQESLGNVFTRGSTSEFAVLINKQDLHHRATVEFIRSVWVRRVEPDPEGCTVLQGSNGIATCEPTSLMQLVGRNLADVVNVTLAARHCGPSSVCSIVHHTKKRILCRLQYDATSPRTTPDPRLPQEETSAAVDALEATPCTSSLPQLDFVLATKDAVFAVPFSVYIVMPPVIHSLNYSTGCSSGAGTLMLKGCRNTTTVHIEGSFLGITEESTLVVLKDHEKRFTARCDIVFWSFRVVSCRLSAAGRGSFAVRVVSLGGASAVYAGISLAPEPKVKQLTYIAGCQSGNNTLALGTCSNNTDIYLVGEGLEGGEVNVSVPGCLCISSVPVATQPASWEDDPELPRQDFLDTEGLPLLDEATTFVRCTLHCSEQAADSASSMFLRVRTVGWQSDEAAVVHFVPPPAILGLSAEPAAGNSAKCLPWTPLDGSLRNRTDGVDLVNPIVPSAPATFRLENCTTGTILTLHGKHFSGPTLVHLVPLTPVSTTSHTFRALPVPDSEQKTDCAVIPERSTANQVVCRLNYTHLPRTSVRYYQLVVKSEGGISVRVPSRGQAYAKRFLEGFSGPWSQLNIGHAVKLLLTRPYISYGSPQAHVHPMIVSLLPKPMVTEVDGCVQTTIKGPLPPDASPVCFVKEHTVITVTGGGFVTGMTVLFAPFTPKPVEEVAVESDPHVFDTNITTQKNLTRDNQDQGKAAKSSGGILSASIAAITGKFSGKEVAAAAVPEPLCVVKTQTYNFFTCEVQPQNRSGLFHFLVSAPGGDASSPTPVHILPRPVITAVTGCQESFGLIKVPADGPQLFCKKADIITITGSGFSTEKEHDELIVKSDTGRRMTDLIIVDASESVLLVSLRHENAEGKHVVQLRTEGGEAIAEDELYLLPCPRLHQIVNVNCFTAGWPTEVSCAVGGQIELQGRNFHGAVQVTMVSGGSSRDGHQRAEDVVTVPCIVINSTSTRVKCRLGHRYEKGVFYPTVTAAGGSSGAIEVTGSAIGHVTLLPVPKIASVLYRKAGQCLEGNGTRELYGCQSSIALTITGENFAPGASVAMRAGNAGGQNGPPECWLLTLSDSKLVCMLDHTSAAGAFELSVVHTNGESDSVRVSVIPGNLYLLFKNTRLVLAVSNTVGWICAVFWTGMFISLVIANERVQSTAGVAPDMVLYNAIGLVCWCVYCCYFYIHSEFGVPVFIQDVVYSFASYICVIAFVMQFWRFGYSGISTFAKLYCLALVSLIIDSGVSNGFSSQVFISGLAKINLACAVVKYIPQAHWNYVRKSTEGYSIFAVWLDLSGAVLMLLQMFFDGIIRHKWSLMITLNVPKFALCCEVILFNMIYGLQHYVLYSNRPVATPVSQKLGAGTPTRMELLPRSPNFDEELAHKVTKRLPRTANDDRS
ncbi:Cystinosin-like protein [Diplonema papillatum]|nr:Cystinosin-like protein [Diplonema papillatum]